MRRLAPDPIDDDFIARPLDAALSGLSGENRMWVRFVIVRRRRHEG
ncbi:MAG: hypothetical protein ABGW68_00305 [Gammaproteobacteria bacterium]|jgi:hypothetical protein